MKRKTHRYHLLYRMVLSFCSISVLACILLTLIVFTAMNSANRSAIERLMSDTMRLTCDHIGTQLQVASKLCDNLTRNVNLQEYLQLQFRDLSEQYSTDLSGSSELMSMVSPDPCINGIYILGENGGIYKSNILSLQDDDFRQTDWYQTIIGNSTPVWFYSKEGSLIVKTALGQLDQFLYIGYPFSDKTTGRNIGIVLAEVLVKELFSASGSELEQLYQISLYDLSGGKPVPIVNGSKALTALLDEQQVPVKQQDMPLYSKQGDIVLATVISPSPWTVISHIQASEIRPYTQQTLVLLLLSVVAVITLSVLLAISLSRSIVGPIHRLAGKMEEVENGDFSISVPVERPDEIGQLSNSFNHLIAKIRSLIEQIYRDQEKLRSAELSAMQAQINPHFLYNSLDSTIWLLKIQQVPKAIEMLQALSTLFRVALSKGRSAIPLSQELQHVNSYLRIQHLRYSQKFDYDLQVEPDALDCQVVKVLIQPLVENSIYHGICEGRKIRIQISVWTEAETVCIRVADDGAGIPEEKLRILRMQLEHPHEPPVQGYGLHNANARVKLFYGKEYGLTVDSVFCQGTTVTVTLPKRRETGNGHV